MRRSGALAALAMLVASPAAGSELIGCSAHFQARAEWMRALDGNSPAAELMARYADLLLRAEPIPPSDWGMRTGPSTPRPPDLQSERDEKVTALMALFAEASHDGRTLPTCVEEPACSYCMEMLPEVIAK